MEPRPYAIVPSVHVTTLLKPLTHDPTRHDDGSCVRGFADRCLAAFVGPTKLNE